MKSRGFTLIELMVGLGISMLCMVLVLMLYKQTLRTSMDASADAEYDSQIEVSVLIIQKLIQNAGYGVDPTIPSHTADIATATQSIYWRTVVNLDATPLTYNCSGLFEEITAKGDLFIHKLRLGTASPCTATTDLASATWGSKKTLISLKSDSNAPLFAYAIGGACSPFGVSTVQGAHVVQITATRPSYNIERAVCLNNIKP